MTDFLARVEAAAARRKAKTDETKHPIDALAERIVALPDDDMVRVMEILSYARDHYRNDPYGIDKAQADLARIKAAGPDEHGVLGTMILDEEFED